ncbi:hypothetical protein [Streptomyces sp. NPDC001770]
MPGQVATQTVLMSLLAGACSAYIALRHPAVGTALLVGVGVTTLVNILMQ